MTQIPVIVDVTLIRHDTKSSVSPDFVDSDRFGSIMWRKMGQGGMTVKRYISKRGMTVKRYILVT